LTTGYCPCGECNGYATGHALFLYIDRWNKKINYGPHKGEKYTGKTAGGHHLRAPQSFIFSPSSLKHPLQFSARLVRPWKWPSQRGTIAADTNYYPLGTKMIVEGWGKGIVDDRGGAIKGPRRLDLFFARHSQADAWGRKMACVEIED